MGGRCKTYEENEMIVRGEECSIKGIEGRRRRSMK